MDTTHNSVVIVSKGHFIPLYIPFRAVQESSHKRSHFSIPMHCREIDTLYYVFPFRYTDCVGYYRKVASIKLWTKDELIWEFDCTKNEKKGDGVREKEDVVAAREQVCAWQVYKFGAVKTWTESSTQFQRWVWTKDFICTVGCNLVH